MMMLMVVAVVVVMMIIIKTSCALYVHCSFVLHLQRGTHKSMEGLANTILLMWNV